MIMNPSQWNSIGIRDYYNRLKPYLSYTITVRSTRLNIPKLSNYQIKLYQKICELRFDENLTWKQVADKLNKLGLKCNGIYFYHFHSFLR